MGRTRQLVGPVALLFSMAVLFVLLPTKAAADIEASTAPAAGNASKPVALRNITHRTEVVNGECGIIFPERALDRKIGKEERRKLCFALQSYGFLTRYMQSVEAAASTWGQDVCLLLSFCGDDCQRLYAHPPHTLPPFTSFLGVSRSPQPSLNQQRVADQNGPLPATEGASSLKATTPKDDDWSRLSSEEHFSASLEKPQSEGLHATRVNKSDLCQANGDFPSGKKGPFGICPHLFMSRASPRISRNIYTLDFEAHHQGFGRFLARVALLIGAADIEKVIDIERQLQQYVRMKRMRTLRNLHSAGARQELRPINPSQATSPFAYSPPSSSRQSSSEEPSVAVQHLEVLLEPLDQTQRAAAPQSSASSENSFQSIQLIFPSNFKAVVSQVQSLGQSGSPVRRLRGSSVALRSKPGSQVRKPASAEIMLNSSVHCSAASSFMSVRHEMKWLQEFIFFLPHQN